MLLIFTFQCDFCNCKKGITIEGIINVVWENYKEQVSDSGCLMPGNSQDLLFLMHREGYGYGLEWSNNTSSVMHCLTGGTVDT